MRNKPDGNRAPWPLNTN